MAIILLIVCWTTWKKSYVLYSINKQHIPYCNWGFVTFLSLIHFSLKLNHKPKSQTVCSWEPLSYPNITWKNPSVFSITGWPCILILALEAWAAEMTQGFLNQLYDNPAVIRGHLNIHPLVSCGVLLVERSLP